MKKCPFCAELIQDEAIKCRFCGELLTGKEVKSKSKGVPDTYINKHIKRTNRNLLLTNIGIIIALLWIWLTGGFEGSGLWGFVWFGLSLFCCWNIKKFWDRKTNPLRHPINVALAKIGPCQQIANLINQEVKTPKLNNRHFIVTESWLLKPTFYGLQTILLGELAWIYKKVTQNYTYFIPTNKTFAVLIYKRDGNTLEVSCSQEETDILLKGVMESAPWVVGGFSDELQRLWDSDRTGFVAYIDERKREISSK